jgi:hypothetical protein
VVFWDTYDNVIWISESLELKPYGTNGLNQLTSAGATALGYDGRGNLTSSGSSLYTYTSENRLATGPGGVALTYDPRLTIVGLRRRGPSVQTHPRHCDHHV